MAAIRYKISEKFLCVFFSIYSITGNPEITLNKSLKKVLFLKFLLRNAHLRRIVSLTNVCSCGIIKLTTQFYHRQQTKSAICGENTSICGERNVTRKEEKRLWAW